ncbi:MAG: hypothetical protein R3E12_09165 [Candidatus Eisenbacteria bacterium]
MSSIRTIRQGGRPPGARAGGARSLQTGVELIWIKVTDDAPPVGNPCRHRASEHL